MKFNELPIRDSLIEATKKLGFDDATDIQEQVIPKAINGVDIIAQAPTGTGKTCAFGLPILNNIDENLVVNLEQAAPQTIRIPVHVESIDELNKIELMKMNPDDKVEFDLLSVRVIYE